MDRKAWLFFAVVQLFGEVGPWAGLHMKSSLGPALWVIGFVVMLPGRLLGLFVTEKLLWGVRLTAAQTTGTFVLIEIACNLLVWLGCARLFRWRSEGRTTQ
jgi:hypothetical protein